MKKAKKIALVFFTILMVLGLVGIVAAYRGGGHPGPHHPGPHYPGPHYPHHHCFIATAAGNSGQVTILTEFRDRWLASNHLGLRFIGFYNVNGPKAAQWLQEHESIKPVVRCALYPVVGFAYVILLL